MLSIASPLFHFGSLMVIMGHLTGLFVPASWTDALGMSDHLYHLQALLLGAPAGFAALLGIGLLIYRRCTHRVVFLATTRNDKLMYVVLVCAIVAGLSCTLMGATPYGEAHDYRQTVSVWFRSIWILEPRGDPMAHAAMYYQIHALIALGLFALWPFTRLVHAFRAGTRLILRRERPHPGAQLRFTDADGMRVTAFITDTEPGVIPGQVAGLELRHRQHARIEDRIRELKATGLRNLPCHGFWANAAWLEITLTAADLVTWARLIGFGDQPALARAEITTFRYRVLHVAARITHGARRLRLRIDATWRWAAQIATAWQAIRTAFG